MYSERKMEGDVDETVSGNFEDFGWLAVFPRTHQPIFTRWIYGLPALFAHVALTTRLNAVSNLGSGYLIDSGYRAGSNSSIGSGCSIDSGDWAGSLCLLCWFSVIPFALAVSLSGRREARLIRRS